MTRHEANCVKRRRHPQNRKYITYHSAAKGGPIHGDNHHAQKFGEFGTRGFWDTVKRLDRQGQTDDSVITAVIVTNRQTKWHTHHNASHLYRYFERAVPTKRGKITHRPSMAKRDGCFQWRPMFIFLFVNTITSERLNIGWWSLVASCTVQKFRLSSNLESWHRPRSLHPNMSRFVESLRMMWACHTVNKTVNK